MNQQHLKWLIAATISVVVILQWMGWSADSEPYVGDFEGFTVQAPAQEDGEDK